MLRNNEDASVRERTCVLLLHMTRLNPKSLSNAWHQTLTNDIEFLKNDPCPNVVQVCILYTLLIQINICLVNSYNSHLLIIINKIQFYVFQ